MRDGEADTASCGTEIDTAIADQQTLDVVDPDCETVSFLPADPGGDDGGDGGGGDGEITFSLTAKARQRIVRRGVVVKVGCPRDACSAVASAEGKVSSHGRGAPARLILGPVVTNVPAGGSAKVKLRLRRRQRHRVRDALGADRAPKLAVTVTAGDAAGNQATKQVTVKAKR